VRVTRRPRRDFGCLLKGRIRCCGLGCGGPASSVGRCVLLTPGNRILCLDIRILWTFVTPTRRTFRLLTKRTSAGSATVRPADVGAGRNHAEVCCPGRSGARGPWTRAQTAGSVVKGGRISRGGQSGWTLVAGWFLLVAGVAFVIAGLVVLVLRLPGGMEPFEYYRVARLAVGGALLAYLGRRLARRRSAVVRRPERRSPRSQRPPL
jgi:hypothetical protein